MEGRIELRDNGTYCFDGQTEEIVQNGLVEFPEAEWYRIRDNGVMWIELVALDRDAVLRISFEAAASAGSVTARGVSVPTRYFTVFDRVTGITLINGVSVDTENRGPDPRTLPGPRVFVAHPKGWEDDYVDHVLAQVRGQSTVASFVAGRDDWRYHVKARKPGPRSWDTWTRQVADSYTSLAVPVAGDSPTIGMATARLVEAMRSRGKECWAWDMDHGTWAWISGVEFIPEAPPTDNYLLRIGARAG